MSLGLVPVATAAIAVCSLCCAGTAFAAPAVDDGRAVELVSTGVELGRNVKTALPVADADGDRVLFELDAPQSDSGGARIRVYRLGTRSSAGWTSKDVNFASPGPAAGEDQFDAVSPDGTRLIVDAAGLAGTTFPQNGVYAVDTATRAATRVAPGEFVAASASTRVLFFRSGENLAAGADQYPADLLKLYRVDDDGVSLASAVPPEDFTDPFATTVTSLQEGALYGPATVYDFVFDTVGPFEAGLVAEQVRMPLGGAGRRHVVSTDGDRLFFRAGQQRSAGNGLSLMPLWVSDETLGAVAVSASRRTGEDAVPRLAQFIGASPDGLSSSFVSGVPLQDGEQGGGVYRYDLATRDLTRLTPDVPAGTDEVDGFSQLGVSSAWTSDDGSTVYLVSTADLADGATGGERNAYVWRDGQLRYVADVGSDGRVQRVTRDGRFAVFTSSTIDPSRTGSFKQIYRYDDATGELACASCRADGSTNAGEGFLSIRFGEGGLDRTENVTSPRNVADDGRVFFTSADPLVPQDRSAAPDVYEFDGAAVRLLSTGEGVSYLADNTDDGRSVYLVSSASLTSADDDGGYFDLYVRRTGGGFPEPGPSTDAPCAGDDCQGPGAAQPAVPVPASDRVGTGNVPSRSVSAILSAPSVTAASRRALARGARGGLSVRLRGPGRLSVKATATVRGRKRAVASVSTRVASDATQTKRVTLRLGRSALDKLRRRGSLRLSISVALSGAGSRTTVLQLRRKAR